MTKNANPTNCLECGVRLNSRNRENGSTYNDVCTICYELWGWENTHNDEGHSEDWFEGEQAWKDVCWICHPELNPRNKDAKDVAPSVPTGRKNRSHKDCKHEATPKARAACRKANA